MTTEENYGKKYFEGIYAHLKKEKELIFHSFFQLLSFRKKRLEKILDLGCGEGDFLKICYGKRIECYGADISSYALKKARKRIKTQLKKLDLEKERLPWPAGFFDAVTAFDLLEHLHSADLLLAEARRVLKKEGVFFATTPNADFFLAKVLGKIIPGDRTHVNLQGVGYWQAKLKQAGFSETGIKGCLLFGFPPSLDLRWFSKRLGLPVCTRPILFPILRFTPELFIFARK